eukprot:TRINITY_DN4881_c0_g1_i1.p1 TRINITY_DN4881_c0_g1~~TRINITY_DN4881_c0_g1_i1.p1  ORF type:complete len:1571 (-),score=264.66 TRINITY_DN4881_c0_g1_i1:211-4749(-)
MSLMGEIKRFIAINQPVVPALSEVENKSILMSKFNGLRRVASVNRLELLCSLMKENKEELEKILLKNNMKSDDLTQEEKSKRLKYQKLFAEFIQCLIKHCSSQHSDDIKIKAAECIGIIVSCDPTLMFYLNNNSQKQLPYNKDDPNQADDDDETVKTKLRISVLEKFSEYITHTDLDLYKAASESLKNVLSTASGRKTFDENLNSTLQSYLKPFRGSKSVTNSEKYLTSEVDPNKLWSLNRKTYKEWITNLTTALCIQSVTDEFIKLCYPVCKTSSEFAEYLFPYIILDILINEKIANVAELLSEHVLNDSNSNVSSIQLVLNTINFLKSRAIILSKKLNENNVKFVPFWNTNFWNSLDYLALARSAQKCYSYFSSLMYYEIVREVESDNDQNSEEKSADSIPRRKILLDIFSNIDEPDSIHGIDYINSDIWTELRKYEHDGKWSNSLAHYDMMLQHYDDRKESSIIDEKFNLQYGIMNSLQSLGLHHVLNTYINGHLKGDTNSSTSSIKDDYSEFQYEYMWKNFKFKNTESSNDYEEPTTSSGDSYNFHESVYKLLKAIITEEKDEFNSILNKIRLKISKDIGSLLSFESSKALHPLLLKLHFFDDIVTGWKLKWNPSDRDAVIENTHQKWIKTTDGLTLHKFEEVQPLLSLHCTLLKTVTNATNDEITQTHFRILSKLARKAGRTNFAMNTVFQAKSDLESFNSSDFSMFSWFIEETKIHWSMGDHNKAIKLAKSVLSKYGSILQPAKGKSSSKSESNKDKLSKVYADLLTMTGKWLSDTRTENTDVIAIDYCKKAVDIYKEAKGNTGKGLFHYARFADNIYEAFREKFNSSEWKASLMLKKKKEQDLERYKNIIITKTKKKKDDKMHPLQGFYNQMEKQVKMDQQEVDLIQQNSENFLNDAIIHYMQCITTDDAYDVHCVFRLCSLWFSNSRNSNINKVIKSLLPKVSSHKFLPLFYQIASRMSSKSSSVSSSFRDVLNRMIERTAGDHPHHSLYQIFALANGGKVPSKSGRNLTIDNDKIEAAQNIITKLKTNKQMIALMDAMGSLINAYIQLSDLNVSKHKHETKPLPLSKTLDITKIEKLPNINLVHIPTTSLPVSKTAKYNSSVNTPKQSFEPHHSYLDSGVNNITNGDVNIISIVNFEKTYQLCGGLNLPKIIKCVGSDGILYKQLVKGNDDMRQDAVMQQMFSMVNTLLSENPETRKRKLHVRTYKVLPLTPCSGILEWVKNTLPIGTWLVGSNLNQKDSAHYRYYPNDWISLECRKKITDIPEEKKLSVYEDICNHFHPVFRHFFLENYTSPHQWFQKRLNYTRSVASNSVVGYVLGLGDRHSQNILIDVLSGDLVHIDLGVTFEQGKALKTPEIVPFRLTRDIVDAMGITGVEGVFRSCCEETMKVLRAQHSKLMTIVEVFVHDPLYRWALSPVKALRIQHNDEDENDDEDDDSKKNTDDDEKKTPINADVERTLIRLRQKLQGIENGQTLSVNGIVQQLISEATSPNNLCRMFPGWAPWV